MPEMDLPPLRTRFTLGVQITDEQRRFLDRHGFLLFANVATPDEVAMLGREIDRIEADWLSSGRRRVQSRSACISSPPTRWGTSAESARR